VNVAAVGGPLTSTIVPFFPVKIVTGIFFAKNVGSVDISRLINVQPVAILPARSGIPDPRDWKRWQIRSNADEKAAKAAC
jgi:hypothetical protein